MAVVTYVEHDGTRHAVDVQTGYSVMQGAMYNGVPGIVAECGGGLACATCHCLVDAEWTGRTGTPSEIETEMLATVPGGPQPNSRLSCQIAVDDTLDGLVVHLPETQF